MPFNTEKKAAIERWAYNPAVLQQQLAWLKRAETARSSQGSGGEEGVY